MSIDTTNIQEQICRLKHAVNKDCPDIMERFREIEARVSEDIRAIESSIQQGKSVIPEIMYSDIVNNNVDYKTIESLRRNGTVVIRNVFSREKSEEWFNEASKYINT